MGDAGGRPKPAAFTTTRDGATIISKLETCGKLLAAAMLAALLPTTTSHAQQVLVIINGEPITALDVDQRMKLQQLSGQKAPVRQEVLDELINEKLKVREAKKWGLEITDAEVDSAFASM